MTTPYDTPEARRLMDATKWPTWIDDGDWQSNRLIVGEHGEWLIQRSGGGRYWCGSTVATCIIRDHLRAWLREKGWFVEPHRVGIEQEFLIRSILSGRMMGGESNTFPTEDAALLAAVRMEVGRE